MKAVARTDIVVTSVVVITMLHCPGRWEWWEEQCTTATMVVSYHWWQQ